MTPNPGRRDYDQEGGALVVPLREYLEDKIDHSHRELAAEIKTVHAELVEGRAQNAREHTAAERQRDEILARLTELEGHDQAQKISLATLRAIALTFAALAAFVAAVVGVVVQLT